jgi:hypothetical protein
MNFSKILIKIKKHYTKSFVPFFTSEELPKLRTNHTKKFMQLVLPFLLPIIMYYYESLSPEDAEELNENENFYLLLTQENSDLIITN